MGYKAHSHVVWVVALGVFANAGGLKAATPVPQMQTPTLTLLRHGEYEMLDAQLSNLQHGYELGTVPESDLADDFRVFYDTDPLLAPKLDSWVQHFPKSYVAHLARGIYYKRVAINVSRSDVSGQYREIEQSAFKQAALDLDASIQLTRKPLLSYFHALDATAVQFDHNDARRSLRMALQVDPNTFIVRDKYMDSLRESWGGSVALMRAFLEECRMQRIRKADLQALRAVVLDEQGKRDERAGKRDAAERDYRQAVSMGRGDCLPCAHLGNLLMDQKRYAEAIPVWTLVLNADPHNTGVRVNRAFAAIEVGDQRQAIEDWKIASAEGDTDSQDKLGVLYMQGVPGLLPADPKAGVALFRRAAAQGDKVAQHNLDTALFYNHNLCEGDECGRSLLQPNSSPRQSSPKAATLSN